MDQFDRTAPNIFIQLYIARYADVFQSYAANLGLPPTAALAAASAVSEEMRNERCLRTRRQCILLFEACVMALVKGFLPELLRPS